MRYTLFALLLLLSLSGLSQTRPDTSSRNRPKVNGTYSIIPFPSGRLAIIGQKGFPIAPTIDSTSVPGLGFMLSKIDLKPSVIGALSQFATYTLPTAIFDGSLWSRVAGNTTTATPGYGAMLTASVGGFYYERIVENTLNARWFGVKGDGQQNEVPFLQAALNFASAKRIAQVQMPSGRYKLSGNTSVTLPIGVKLLGGRAIPVKDPTAGFYQFDITIGEGATTTPAFVMNPSSGLEGFSFYYPNQLRTLTSPILYGWTISTSGLGDGQDGIQLRNLMLTNPYQAIKLDWGSQHRCENLYGQPLKTGLWIDRAYDANHFTSIHFWPFHTLPGDNLYAWVAANGIAFDIRHVDGGKFTDILTYGYKTALWLHAGVDGEPWVTFSDVLFDVSDSPVIIDALYRGQFSDITVTGLTVATSQDGMLINKSVNRPDIDLLISNYTCANFTTGIRNKGVLRAVISGVGKLYQTNVNNGVRWFEIVNENDNALITYNTALTGDQHKRISGRVALNGAENYQTLTDITPAGLSTPHSWSVTAGSGTATAITNGSRLSAGVVSGTTASPLTVRSFPLPAQVASEHGLFVLKTTLKANQTAGLNVVKFYIRVRDFSVTPNVDFNILPTAFDAYMNDSTVISVPFLYSGSPGGVIDIICGENITSSPISFELTNTKLFKASGYSSAFIERMPKHQGYAGRITPGVGEPTYPLSTDPNSSTTASSGPVPYAFTMATDRALVQSVINANLNTGIPVVLGANFIDVGTTPLVIGASSGLTIDGQNRCELRSSTGSQLLMVSAGAISNLRITGLRFNSTWTGGGYSMFLSNETAQINGMEIDHCYFTCPNGQFNALNITQYSTGSSSGQTSYDINIHDCVGYNIGRMFCEVLSQGYDGVLRIQGFKFCRNVATNLGMNNEYGMMISVSALSRDITIDDNRCTDAQKIAFEVVNAIDVSITNNKTWWTGPTKNFVGISISDDSHSTTSYITIKSNVIRSRGNTLQLFGVQNWSATGNVLLSTSPSDGGTSDAQGRVYIAQNANGVGWTTSKGVFSGNTVETASKKAVEIDNATFNRIEGNYLSNALGTVGTERVTIRNSLATGNVVQNNTYAKNASNGTVNNVNETGGATGNSITQ